ncbi:DUF4173 domain-containing protein [candidate division WWE3 bacterium]|nr:DUF4173 domain-containing protein [candidate division WWE3 bacterium]
MFIFTLLVLTLIPLSAFIALLLYFADKNESENQKQNILRNKKQTWFATLILVTGLNLFLYKLTDKNSIGFALANITLLTSMLILLPRKRPIVYVLSSFYLITAIFTLYRANMFVQTVNQITLALLFLLLIVLAIFPKIKWNFASISRALGSLFTHFPKNFPLIGKFLKSQDATAGDDLQEKGSLNLLKTFVITLFILIGFSALLAAADPVFDSFVSAFIEQAFGRLIFSLFVSFGLWFLFVSKDSRETTESTPYKLKFLSAYDTLIPIAALALLFGVFIFVQARYLFGSHEYVQAHGITYSEYVRKGFIELLVTAFLSSLISYFVVLKTRVISSVKDRRPLQAVNVVLGLETLVMLFSAFERDRIYIDTYGLTRVRIIGLIFLAWLVTLVLGILLLNLVKTLKDKHFYLGMVVSSFLVVLTLNLINIDALIVAAQIPSREYVEKDYYYMSLLSEDAVFGWTMVLEDAQDFVNTRLVGLEYLSEDEKRTLADLRLALKVISRKKEDVYKKYAPMEDLLKRNLVSSEWLEDEVYSRSYLANTREWKEGNVSQRDAYKEISENEGLYFETLDCLLLNIDRYALRLDVDFYPYEQERLDELDYPFTENPRIYPESRQSILGDVLSEDAPSSSVAVYRLNEYELENTIDEYVEFPQKCEF